MDISFLDRLVLVFQFDGNLFHDIWLCGIYLYLIILALLFLRIIFKTIISIFKKDEENTSKISGRFTIFLALSFFIVGLFVINYCFLGFSNSLNASSESAVVYDLEGAPVVATLSEGFHTTSSSQYGTTGSGYLMVETVDLNKGERLFSTELVKGYVGGDPKIICVEGQYIFANIDGTVYVVDNTNGEIIKEIKQTSNGVLFVDDETQSVYDETYRNILIKGEDGLVYGINVDALDVKPTTADPVASFPKKPTFPPVYERGSTLAMLDEQDYLMFLTDSDMNNLQNRQPMPDIFDDSAERRCVYSGNLQNLENLKKLSPDVFLLGGLLIGNEISENMDTTHLNKRDPENYDSYITIRSRGDVTGYTPFQAENKDIYYVVHRETVDPNSNLLFSALSIKQDKTLWSIHLEGNSLNNYLMVDDTHMLIFVGSGGGSIGDSSHILYISLEDGTGIAYNYQYHKTLPVEIFAK